MDQSEVAEHFRDVLNAFSCDGRQPRRATKGSLDSPRSLSNGHRPSFATSVSSSCKTQEERRTTGEGCAISPTSLPGNPFANLQRSNPLRWRQCSSRDVGSDAFDRVWPVMSASSSALKRHPATTQSSLTQMRKGGRFPLDCEGGASRMDVLHRWSSDELLRGVQAWSKRKQAIAQGRPQCDAMRSRSPQRVGIASPAVLCPGGGGGQVQVKVGQSGLGDQGRARARFQGRPQCDAMRSRSPQRVGTASPAVFCPGRGGGQVQVKVGQFGLGDQGRARARFHGLPGEQNRTAETPPQEAEHHVASPHQSWSKGRSGNESTQLLQTSTRPDTDPQIRMFGRRGGLDVRPSHVNASKVSDRKRRRSRTRSAKPRRQKRARSSKIEKDAQDIPPDVVQRSPATLEEFFHFMRERESIRIRRELRNLSPPWTDDAVMRRVRLTNVKREMDKTTRAMRELTNAKANGAWLELERGGERLNSIEPLHRKPWTKAQLHMAGLIVFNCALWRAFGTLEFAQALGFVEDWGPEMEARTQRIALLLWQKGIAVFTEAYDPARRRHYLEASNRAQEDPSHIHRVIRSACRSVFPVWEARKRIAEEAFRTSSWRSTTRSLMQVTGYGGTGFLAKEVVQDLLHTPLFQDLDGAAEGSRPAWHSVCVDENEWCAIGPGARRGLNRLAGRPVKHGVTDSSLEAEKAFLAELKEIYAGRHENNRWPAKLLERDLEDLALHDVQFQLCEFDKYLRAKLNEGRVRPFEPGSVKNFLKENVKQNQETAEEPETVTPECSPTDIDTVSESESAPDVIPHDEIF